MAGRTRGHGQSVNSIVASATRYRGNQAPAQVGIDKGWQESCYRHRTINGLARYGATYYGNALSRCTLTVEEPSDDGWKTVTGAPENVAMAELFAGAENQPAMLNAIGQHLTVGGECFIVGRSVPLTESESLFIKDAKTWEVISPLEMQTIGKFWAIQYEGMQTQIPLTEDDDVIRIWRPDPRHRLRADSPFRALLYDLDQMEQLTLHTFSQIRSRLINAGILFISENMRLPKKPPKRGQQQELSGADQFMTTLADLMNHAISDQGSPAANIPLVVQVPDDTIDKVKLVEFWSKLDEQTNPMYAAAAHRFAQGMDLPNEIIEGMSSNPGTGGGNSNGVSHWGAWQIEEATIKVHLEPMLDLVANAFTVGYLRIVVPGTTKRVGYSTTGLKLRPDRSKEAFQLFDRGAISLEALRRENGFGEDDKLEGEDLKTWILFKIAGGSATPDQVAAAAGFFGAVIPGGQPAVQDTRESRPPPSLESHPTRPRTPEPAALVVACDAMVLSALQRVGNRLVQKGVRPEGVSTYAVHCYTDTTRTEAEKLLRDAFPMANEILAGIAEPAEIMPALHQYVMSRLVTRNAHSRQEMVSWLNLVEA